MNAEELASLFHSLRLKRQRKKQKSKENGTVRRRLSQDERAEILQKTGGRCHVCGGQIDGRWQADHVMAHSRGGKDTKDNYLPAHSTCNNYRWDYSPEEFQNIMKLGVWLRTHIEKRSVIGLAAAEKYVVHDRARIRRRHGSGK